MSSGSTREAGYALDAVNFFVAAMQAGFGAFVTVLLVRNHWAAQDIGFALTISTIASLCSQIPAAVLIDAIREKRRPDWRPRRRRRRPAPGPLSHPTGGLYTPFTPDPKILG